MFEITPYTHRSLDLFDPFRELSNFERGLFGKNSVAFSTDIRDNGDSYLLEADLPGFEKKDIHLDINGDVLTVSAERHSAHEEKDEKGKYIRCERSYGAYSREFDLSGIAADKIGAKYENGVLKLTLPKKQEQVPASRRLEIE